MKSFRGLLAFGLLALAVTAPLSATTLIYDLVAVLNCTGLNAIPTVPCPLVSSFGTVTFDDVLLPAGQVRVTVDLLNPLLKFRDLAGNYSGTAATISSSDGQVSLAPDTYFINPYNGLFDVGSTGAQGWDGPSGYTTILSGNIPLTVGDFFDVDTLGNFGVVIHVQSLGIPTCTGFADGSTTCLPGTFAGDDAGSLKLGGLSSLGPFVIIPEPSTYVLMGAGIIALGLLGRHRRS